uniref:Uncharacterized protein n=1 Tax=Chromera velia CCMP2878 TaxID=1169474 RepID=A0A0G4F2S7_9ALVE|eukprot:Cvel_14934.t1-p1 / transcript=Cvel_14934.t1 / gene=Cvel_14934 / organism=Chromera_velia_CCMP2878 / gene_product=hypothetical protein / transcript_product=hypothetical protein / location=Cvel_scaffold1083:27912-28781(-) / protein_length=290 / sequence_SO=supercontig / SO=protein_coding / is_pseudo=false
MGIKNPKTEGGEARATSQAATRSPGLTQAIQKKREIEEEKEREERKEAHKEYSQRKRAEEKERWERVKETEVLGVTGKQRKTVRDAKAKQHSGWLSVVPQEADDMLLNPEEFRDALTLCYQFKVQGDKRNYEGCGGSWGLQHALNYKRGGHVGRRYNKVNQAWCDLAELVFASAVGRGGLVVRAEGEVPGRPAFYGDFSEWGLWARQRQAILDTRVLKTQTASYVQGDWQKVLIRLAMGKKEQYAEPCRDKGYDFMPLVSSVDRALEKDVEMFPKKVAHLVSLKWNRTYR